MRIAYDAEKMVGVEVSDPREGHPALADPMPDDESGRGFGDRGRAGRGVGAASPAAGPVGAEKGAASGLAGRGRSGLRGASGYPYRKHLI
ncbi:hypothetical protein GCM10009579_58060 [Streptomyces javensis]|uniref:DUF2283 domain-containing protein n=1 Tax=Streptomyces javensis TaxID=114698 RepID=A0ABN1X7F0_9ACTN